MKRKEGLRRREFLVASAGAAFGRSGSSVHSSRLHFSPKRVQTRQHMRLDAHIHVPNASMIEGLSAFLSRELITHFVAILEDLTLIGRLERTGATALPFLRLRHPVKQEPRQQDPVAGYKLHLRHPVTQAQAGGLVTASDRHLKNICGKAQQFGRPIIFHADADQPQVCSLPQLALLAQRYPDIGFIAAHTGLYTQEYQGETSNPGDFMELAGRVARENIQLLLEVDNLYADMVLLGRDYPGRSHDPEFKLKLLRSQIQGLSRPQKKRLAGKLFLGSDFPNFQDPQDLRSSYLYQLGCMMLLFAHDWDENRAVANFLRLLPEEFRRSH